MKSLVVSALCALAVASPAAAKKKPAAAVPQASAQTAGAIGKLARGFKWDISHEDAMKIVAADIAARYDDKIKKETIAAKQDLLLKKKNEELEKLKDGYIKFDGQKTGWDVSIVDKEFVHKNDESMLVVVEENQRRFLFFWNDRLWKQFIVFSGDHPLFAGKTFDDFADIIQKKYGPASVVFKSKRTSDEQTLDHLEWPPSGDFLLWAIDLTTFYNNFCLSLMKRSALKPIEVARNHNNPQAKRGNAIVDQVLRGDEMKGDANADIVDEITGRTTTHREQPTALPSDTGTSSPKPKKPSSEPSKSEDPLEGMKL